eukprot:6199677-Pleurochrysis_carterae.AAC.5
MRTRTRDASWAWDRASGVGKRRIGRRREGESWDGKTLGGLRGYQIVCGAAWLGEAKCSEKMERCWWLDVQ